MEIIISRFGNGVDLQPAILEVHVTFDPCAVGTFRHVIFHTTGRQALAGSDALLRIDEKAEQLLTTGGGRSPPEPTGS